MRKCLLKAMLVAMFMVVVAFAWGQSVFYQEPFDANQGWTLDANWSITAGALKLNWSPSATNYDFSATSPNIAVPASAGDIVISQYIDEYTGQGTPPETYEIIVVAGGTPTVLWAYSTDTDWGATGGQDLTLSLAPFAGQTIQLKFHATGEDSFNYNYWYIYGITAYANLAIDMGAVSLTGSTTPTQGTATNYIVTVKNNGTTAVTAYTVKLMNNATVELGTQAGTALAVGATRTHTFSWTPAAAGPAALTGKVIVTGDLNPNNDITAVMNITVQPTGIQAVTIGAGDQTARMPMDFFFKCSLYETLYLSDELGFASGTITSLALYNNFLDSPANGATKIWLGTTSLMDLSAGYIPSTQMTLVYDGTLNYPMGTNTIMIPLTTPYMHTPGNLVMMVKRPLDGAYYSSSDYFQCQTVGTNRARNQYSDSIDFDPAAPTPGTLTGQFPKITIFYTGQALVNDMSCQSVTGNVTPSAASPWNYTVTVKNNGTAVQSNYQVKLFKQGDIEVGSVNGTAINSLQSLQFTIPWTPTATGPTFLYGKVVLAGDEIAQNNQSANYPVVVQAAGIVAITVGTGGSTGKFPLDMYYKASLSETIYLATELNIGGLLTGIQYYNTFTTDLPNKPTQIWAGETTLTDLSGGWIPSTQLTLVYDGNVNYPTGANSINIPFTTPLPYGGGNLAIMVKRPLDAAYFSSSDNFVTQTVGTNRTLKVQNDTTDYDPTAPAAATPTGMFPKTTFFFITQGMGALNGTVSVGGSPLAGATVTVANTTLTYTTGANGTYSFPYIAMGAQAVSATKHGYTVVTNNVTIVEDQTATSNFTIALLPQVTVTGKIVGSDAPTVGIAGATIALSGYEPYTATTNATGNFTIAGVFASQTYNYTANATGYATTTGTVVVGTSNVNMANVIVNEITFPPYGVVAAEAANFSNVAVTWHAPNPGAQGITEGFEGTVFPPTDWTQVITNTEAAGTTGVSSTWGRVGSIALTPAVPPHGGAYQAAMWWSYTHQDEWLKTPQFTCPPAASMNFWSYVFLGSVNNDHYYIKVSTDNGVNWTTLWDATAQTGGQNAYTAPLSVDLAAYAGQQIKLALHAEDPPSNDGLWYVWFVDDITIGSPTGVLRFNNEQLTKSNAAKISAPQISYPTLPASRALVSNPKLVEPALTVADNGGERTMLGYKVWRLLAANQANEALWTLLTPASITPAIYTDATWQPLPSGVYKYAVKSIYTNNVGSTPAFSNEIHKGMMGTLSGTVTEFGTSLPVAGATVTAGEYSGVTNATGAYSFGVYAGTYAVTCTKPSYQPATQAGVVIVGMQPTTQNFVMTEITLPPAAVQAAVAGNNIAVTWMAPGTGGADISEGFEGATFPPTDWTQVITNTEPAGTTGVASTWGRVGSIALTPAVPPHGGDFQAAMWWSYTHQDEWLKTPQFTCPPAAAFNFWGYVFLGSVNNDHYYVKVSTDNGVNWTTLWDATAQTGGQNAYTAPLSVDLAAYAGQQIKLALHAEDPPSNDGMWYVWFVDDITVGSPTGVLRFNNEQLTRSNAAKISAPQISYPTLPASRAVAANPNFVEATLTVANNGGDRALTGYKVWRLMQGQETNESAWTGLTTNAISATAYQDNGWGPLPDGTYKWAVKAVYTGGAYSIPAMSNPLTKQTQIGTVAGIVRNQQNQAISGATVTTGAITATTNASGAYSMTVGQGTHSVTASHPNYSPVTQTGVIVVTGQTTTVNFQLPASANLFVDGFETYPNFALTFAPWTLVDVDMSVTYGMTDVTFENSGTPMAFIVFNPSAATPPVTTVVPHAGAKIAASFAAVMPADGGTGPNNDWMITGQYTGVTQFKFWAKSLTATYGLERFKVGVSTTGTAPANFTIVSGANYISAPIDWTEYTYDLPTYSTVPIRIGINCVSNDAFVFMVDDVTIRGGSANEDPIVPVVVTELKNNFPNPFNPETTIAYSVKETSPVSIQIYNVKGQLVKTLENSVKESGEHTAVWNGKDSNGRAVSSGIYYYKMNAGKYSSTKKMIMMK